MPIRVGASEQGGTFYTQALALKVVLGRVAQLPSVDVVESLVGASIENANLLEVGALDFAFISAPWVAAAKNATAPFSRSIDLKTVAPMNLGPNFFVVRADSALQQRRRIARKKARHWTETGGMTPHAEAVLDSLGLVQAILSGSMVPGCSSLGSRCPVSAPCTNQVMTELSERIPVRVLRYKPNQMEAALKAVPYDRATIMKKGAIRGLDEDLAQLGVLNLLVAHARADENITRLVVQAILNNAAELSSRLPLFAGLPELLETTRLERCASLEFDGVTLHPGAARAYAEAGYLAG